jgi:uncharacterized protein (TIGR02996 family)
MNSDQEQQDGFLQAIREEPEDDGLRLIYADWLEERGDPQGELIRLQCQIARLDPGASSRAELEDREREILSRYEAAWMGAPRSEAWNWVFSRGFVEKLKLMGYPLDSAKLAGKWATLAPRTCLRSLTIKLGTFDERWRPADPACMEVLAKSAALASLTALDLSGNRIGAAGVEILVRSPYLSRLTHLNLAGWDFTTKATDEDFHPAIGSEGVLVLAHSPFAARLVELNISWNNLNREAIQALVDSPHLGNLRQLRIGPNSPYPAWGYDSELLPEADRLLVRSRFGGAFDG